MVRKPMEIEAQMVARGATHEAMEIARKQTDSGVSEQWPGYRFVSERSYESGKLLHIARTYEYSRWHAFKCWIKKKLGMQNDPEPVRGA